MRCPGCGADSRAPDEPMRMGGVTEAGHSARLTSAVLRCRCGWSMSIDTEGLRTRDDATLLAAGVLASLGQGWCLDGMRRERTFRWPVNGDDL